MIAPLLENKLIIALGAGGVGKTSSSLLLAIRAAQAGKRVGLLSIDPAKRLADALGLKFGGEATRINFPENCKVDGTLDAAMLDAKVVFDSMVTNYAPSPKIADKILNLPLYQAASTHLGGIVEYMALVKVQQMYDSGTYDLIVLDTPPDSHALDFLDRPNILADFVENGVMSWLIKPFMLAQRFGLGSLMNAGENLMGGLAQVTGIKALHMMAEFFSLMHEVVGGFNKIGSRIKTILQDPKTSFALVTTPKSAAIRSASNLIFQLKARNFALDLLLFNRCLKTAQDPIDQKRLAAERQLIEKLKKESEALGIRPAQISQIYENEKSMQDMVNLCAMARDL